MDKLICITGGIASGKSTVCSIIRKLGYNVISADDVYDLMLSDEDFVNNICDITNTKPVIINGFKTINRKEISEIVFNDEKKLKALMKYTNPKVINKMLEESKNLKGLVFNEVPLLFENKYETYYDNIIVVLRDDKERIKSAIERDKSTEQEIKKRIKNQFNYKKIDINAYTLLYNDGSLKSLEEKVKSIIEKIKSI